MSLKALLALLLPATMRTDAHSEFTQAIADNVRAQRRRRTASVQTTMAAESRAETMDATIHRIEGRSGERLTDNPRPGAAAMRVAEATRRFLEGRRSDMQEVRDLTAGALDGIERSHRRDREPKA